MHPLFWFLVGVATCLAVTLLVSATRKRVRNRDENRKRRRHRRPTPQPPAAPSEPEQQLESAERAELQLARTVLDETSRDLEALAQSLGGELATMATSIEGHAQLLCEAMSEPRRIAERGEWLWGSVQSLRLFSEKILSFAQVDALEVEPIQLRPFLAGLAQELEDSGNRLQVEVQTSAFLPPALGSQRALRNATRFLVDTLLHLETRASRLFLRAYAKVTDDQATRIELELCAEAEESGSRHDAERNGVQLGYIAARNLLEAMDAHLSFDELEGLSVTCFISLPTVEVAQDLHGPDFDDWPDELEAELDPAPEDAAPAEIHDFGGVLVLEDDPAIRELIANELRESDRNVVTCVDGASARSLIQATPERFELVVVEHDARIETGTRIAMYAAERIPGVKVLMMTPGTQGTSRNLELPNGAVLRRLVKPFGVMELRAAFQELLATPATLD